MCRDITTHNLNQIISDNKYYKMIIDGGVYAEFFNTMFLQYHPDYIALDLWEFCKVFNLGVIAGKRLERRKKKTPTSSKGGVYIG